MYTFFGGTYPPFLYTFMGGVTTQKCIHFRSEIFENYLKKRYYFRVKTFNFLRDF